MNVVAASTVASYIEEKFKNENCEEVVILSRGYFNNMMAIEGTLLALKNLEYQNVDVGIKRIKIEDSYIPGAQWFTGLRILLAKGYHDPYQKNIHLLSIRKVPHFNPIESGLRITKILSKDPAEKLEILKPLQEKLKKKKKLLLISKGSGSDIACFPEIIGTLSTGIHFTKEINFRLSENGNIEFIAYLKLV